MVVACSCPSTLCNARWVSINFKVSSEIQDALRCTCCSVLSTELRSSSRNKQSAFVLLAPVGEPCNDLSHIMELLDRHSRTSAIHSEQIVTPGSN
eukprot:scaffold47065_cov60-Attheya_sp.AAC.2